MVRRSHLTCSPKAGLFWLSMFVFNIIMCVGLSFASQNVPALAEISLDNQIRSYDVVFKDAVSVDTAKLVAIGCQPRFIRGERTEISGNSVNIARLQRMDIVKSISPVSDIIPCQGTGTVISEAVQFTGALAMQTNGVTGRGAKVAIIDLGFSGLSAIEVPVALADSSHVISFRSDRSVTASTHGAAVAEQVADMAPDAEYSLLAVDTSMSIEAAIDYVISRDFTVAIMALNIVDGPFDGTHPVSKAVDRAAKNGVFWVQAAGNFAQRHWAGLYKDTNANSKHEFAKSTEYMPLSVTTASHLNVYLSWYETAGATTNRDYDLILRDSTGGFVAQSGISQTGTTPPKEKLSVDLAIGSYRLEIVKISSHTDVSEKFKLFIDNPTALVPTALRIPASSIGIPAEAFGAFTVGATRGTTVDVTPYGLRAMSVDFIEDFSSQGPSLSGSIKPNLVAPDACRTSLAAAGTAVKDPVYHDFVGANAFGTSFAAAHVAGAAALLWSEDNTRTNTSLAKALISMSVKTFPEPPAGQVDPGVPPNNVYGYGRLALRIGVDVTQPVINIIYPRNGDTITSSSPEIKVEITDSGSGVDAETIKLTLDDIEYSVTDDYDETTGLLVFQVPAPLLNGSHRLSIVAADNSGNIATPVVSSFRLASLTIASGLRMISIPYSFIDMDASEIRPATIFGLQSNEINIARWLATDSTPGNKYHVFGGPDNIEDEYASFIPLDSQEPPYVVSHPPAGLGYFINLPKAATVNIGRAQVLSDFVEYNVKLSYGFSQPRGWNMIGCPFPDATSWSTVQFITNGVRQDLRDAISSGVTEGILFELKNVGGSVYYDFPSDPLSSSLQPWKGYWVHVLKDTTLVMYNGAVTEAASDNTNTTSQAITNDGWTLKFGASTAGGLDPANYIGVSSAASVGYDAGLDVPKPPALSTPVRVSVVNNDWSVNSGEYARDIQSLGSTKITWDVNVACSVPNSLVTVAWPEINECVPAGVSLVLKDTVTGKTIPMRSVSSYAFQCGDVAETRSFIITAENTTSSALVINNITTSQVEAGRISFAYSVSADADVTAEILSIAGRPIASISTSDAIAGEVSVVSWNGLNSAGSRAPTGRYMLRLSARSVDGTMAQAVRAFSLSR